MLSEQFASTNIDERAGGIAVAIASPHQEEQVLQEDARFVKQHLQ